MSLSYKLWKIGKVLSEEDIKAVIKLDPSTEEEPGYINLDFNIRDYRIISLELKKEAVSRDRMFFTKKMGGSGTGIYYLYPNLELKLKAKERAKDKLAQLVNTIKNSVMPYSNDKNQKLAELITDFFDNNADYETLSRLKEIRNGYYWFWISVNGKTFPEIMPEVWANWYKSPVVPLKEASQGYDVFTNKETIVGYRPEFKIFSYDQYHDSLNYRIRENLPLSLESARNIKFAWSYILEKLVFFYKGLEYIIIPNMLYDDKEAYRKILKRLVRANKATKRKPGRLDVLRKEEKQLKKELSKLEREQKRKKSKDMEKEKLISHIDKKHRETMTQIYNEDTGFISEFKEQADYLEELKNSVTLDFIFTSINRTNLSFELKGAIEDVIPSRLSMVVDAMRKFGIEDNITLSSKKRDKIYLQDFFNRDELYFVLSKSQNQNKNRILQERLHLARLLLTDETITRDDILSRFEFNREYDYEHKKRIKDGVKDWIDFPQSYTHKEKRMMEFFCEIKKLKE